MDIYAELGVRKIINGNATLTMLGGSLMPPEVLAAMAEAARSFVNIDELQEKAGRKILLEIASQQGMRAMATQWARPMIHPSRHGTPLFEAVLDMLERSNAEQFAAQIRALLTRPDAGLVLPTIACPTLVLTGREDLWSPPEQHEQMAAAIAGAQLCIVEQCGHMSTLEQPEGVNAAFDKWLGVSA